MMESDHTYFTLTLDSLRSLGGWAADCAERTLPVFERRNASDPRPRAAIEGIRAFADGGKRTADLRRLALAALAAAREIGDPAASAAARAAGMAASSAYTHPLVDVQQTKHVIGPAAFAALALELEAGGYEAVGDEFVQWAVINSPPEVGGILLRMPARSDGKSRLDRLMFMLDDGIRNRA